MGSDVPGRIGPYRISRTIGRGGMGVVYEAAHEASGDRVALKTVRVADGSMLASLRREIHGLARLRHPGIVRIVDHGLWEGIPWYAMEIVDGVSLRLHARAALPETPGPESADTPTIAVPAAGGEPPAAAALPRHAGVALPAPEALALAHRICAPLAFLHGEGLVHRDLKPENVFVRRDGSIVLLDFGLLSRFGNAVSRESLEPTGGVEGTVWYMAPEQARGETVDARADLYALGCMLFELLTGRPPFIAKEAVGVVWKHASQEPPRPSDLAPGISPGIDGLVARLLAKDPRHRLGYADDVARALERLGVPAPQDAAPARPYLYRPALAGRADTLAVLDRELSRIFTTHGKLVLLAGESGVGKTRVAAELAAGAFERGCLVLLGECGGATPGAPGPALGALVTPLRLIADRCREMGAGAAARILGRRGKVLAACEPSLAAIPGVRELPEPDELPPDAARLRLLDALTRVLVRVSREAPVLLVLDDLHGADALTLGLLEHLCRAGTLDRARILLLGTLRPEEAGGALASLRAHPSVLAMDLGRLPEEHVARMVAGMLAYDPPPRALVDTLTTASEGNPFFVAEYLRDAVERGILARDAEGEWQVAAALPARLALPTSLHDLLSRRLSGLDAAPRRAAQVAALLGRDVDTALLGAVAGLAERELLESLGVLLARQVLEELAPGRLRFGHDRMREAAVAALDPGERRALHRRAAEVLEDMGPSPWHVDATRGHHWERAGEPALARSAYLGAARRAAAAYALDEAERIYRAYLSLGAGPAAAEDVRARIELAERVLAVQGAVPQALPEAEAARHDAEAAGDASLRAAAWSACGRVHAMAGDNDLALGCLSRAEALAREAGDRHVLGQVLGRLANVRSDMDEPEAAERLYEEARSTMEATGDGRGAATAVRNLAVMLVERGEHARAEPLLEQALGMSRDQGDRRGEALALEALATLRDAQDLTGPARQLREEALLIARDVGDRRLQGACLGNLGKLAWSEGRPGEALGDYEKALAILREVGNLRGEGVMLGNIAAALLESGRPAEAEALGAEAISMHRSLGNQRALALGLLNQAELHMDAGRHGPAEAELSEARHAFEAIGDAPGAGAAALKLARLSRLRGEAPEARTALLQAARGGLGTPSREDALELACELAFLELASGSAGAEVHHALEAAGAFTPRPGSSLARTLESLRTATAIP